MVEIKENRSVRGRQRIWFRFHIPGAGVATSMAMSLASLTTGSEGGTRASGDARRLRKIRSSPPSFAACDQRFPLRFERFDPNDDSPRRSYSSREYDAVKSEGRARLSCFMVSSKRESHLQVHLPSMVVSLVAVCERFVIVNTMFS